LFQQEIALFIIRAVSPKVRRARLRIRGLLTNASSSSGRRAPARADRSVEPICEMRRSLQDPVRGRSGGRRGENSRNIGARESQRSQNGESACRKFIPGLETRVEATRRSAEWAISGICGKSAGRHLIIYLAEFSPPIWRLSCWAYFVSH
jgi:hypothetical protein